MNSRSFFHKTSFKRFALIGKLEQNIFFSLNQYFRLQSLIREMACTVHGWEIIFAEFCSVGSSPTTELRLMSRRRWERNNRERERGAREREREQSGFSVSARVPPIVHVRFCVVVWRRERGRGREREREGEGRFSHPRIKERKLPWWPFPMQMVTVTPSQ